MERMATDASAVEDCIALLNYGAKVQKYLGYDVENPANAELTEKQRATFYEAQEEAVLTVSADAAEEITEEVYVHPCT